MPEERIKKSERRAVRLDMIDGALKPEDDLAREALESPEALESLCDLYLSKIYGYVLRRVGTVTDAEDITATVFEKVIANLGAFDSNRASFATWIYRIATNCLTDFYRARGRKKETPFEAEDTVPADTRATGDEIEKYDSYMALIEMIGRLPRRYQEALALRYFAEMSVSEVAAALGITETAASKRILRGLEGLRNMARGGELDWMLQ